MHPAYLETRFRITGPEPTWPERFVIVSAYATTGSRWPREENIAADLALSAELERCWPGGWKHRVVGFSPTTGHAEPSWATDLTVDEGCDIGLRFLQNAIYFVIDDEMHLAHCDGRRDATVRVGSFRDRLVRATRPRPGREP